MIIIKKKIFWILIITIGFLFSSTILITKTIAKNSSNKFIIYIDPGHGGFDGGCETSDKKVVEKDISLNVSLILAEYLRNNGYIVFLTRDTDIALANTKKEDIYKRVDLINKSHANIYISIHVNSYPSSIVKGAQVFYKSNNDKSKYLAEILMDKLKLIDENNKRTALAIKNKYLIDHIDIPGCLIELGFLTNPDELRKITDENYIRDTCMTLYLGIVEYLEYLK